MYTLSCQLCLFTRGVSHLKPKHFPSAHGTGRATNAEYFMERTSKSPDKCPHDKVTDKNKCGKIQRCIYIYMMYIYTYIHISLCFHQGCNDNDADSAMMFLPNPFHQLGLHFLHSSTCHERLLYYWIYKRETVNPLRFSGRAERVTRNRVTPICKNQRLVLRQQRTTDQCLLTSHARGHRWVPDHCQMLPLAAW